MELRLRSDAGVVAAWVRVLSCLWSVPACLSRFFIVHLRCSGRPVKIEDDLITDEFRLIARLRYAPWVAGVNSRVQGDEGLVDSSSGSSGAGFFGWYGGWFFQHAYGCFLR